MSNARKLFRILKSLMEYKKINALLGKADSMPIHRLILMLAPRISSFFYWIFDTLIVLSKIKFLTTIDLKWCTYRHALLWTFTNLTQALGAIIELVEIGKEEAKLIAEKHFNTKKASEGKDSPEVRQKEEMLKAKKFAEFLVLIKNMGDTITST